MKKILFLLSLTLVFAGCHHEETLMDKVENEVDEDLIFCTLEYAPVCGKVEVQCVTTPCDPVEETFSNTCMAEAAGAFDIREGACEAENNIPQRGSSILGTFEKSGETAEGFAWYVSYTFNEDGTYEMEGYPDIFEEGNYKVIEQDAAGALVQILDPSMAPLKGYDIQFTFSEDGDYFIKPHDSDKYYRQ